MASREYALYGIFLVTHLLNSNILKNYDGRIDHCIQRNDAHHDLGTYTHEQLESLCVKSMTQMNFKDQMPSVRALVVIISKLGSTCLYC